ncbi:MAG: non-ribosomal peptide synthase/polyketide synthase [Crocosphaera sp.]|nr:non-ribosomal peptide synthase/polyketide synthase [Crocosphaera sp.]
MNYEQLPLSYAQQRLWFLAQLESNSGFYNIPLVLHLEGNLNIEALEKSLEAIINRHEALRTNFRIIEGEPFQIIHPESSWKLTIIKEQEIINNNEEKNINEWLQKESFRPFDLANDPLIRVTLVEQSETEYYLLICLHHIVSDEWSMGVFTQELTTLYNAYNQGLQSPLNDLPIQYGDFALWQREWLEGDILQTQLNYWQKQLENAPELLSLPTDYPRPPEQRFIGSHQTFVLSSQLSEGIKQLSHKQGATLFMTLLTAFNILLYRYTGQTDIVVGTPTANRKRSELEGLIGFFVNTLALRTDLQGNLSFYELLNRVKEKALEAYAYEDLPFEKLVETLQPERNLSYTPLFQVMFGLDNDTRSEIALEGVKVTHQTIENNTAKFDLLLSLVQTKSGIRGAWEYNTDLFDHSTIERLSGHFIQLLEGIITNPNQSINQLPLLTEREQQQLLIDWNQTQVNYPRDLCLHQLFEQQVENNPNAIAVKLENESLTYQELNCRANQLAHYLQGLGVNNGQLVGVLLERSLEMIVGILGILKAGAAYVPLDVNYPQERLDYIFEDTQLNILLTQAQQLEILSAYQGTTICLDRNWDTIATEKTINPVTNIEPHHLAYLIYTSGSTGKPKGVMIEHCSIVNFVLAAIEDYRLTSDDSILQFSSICFDASVEEIFCSLSSGATLVLRTDQMLRSSEDFWQCCQAWQLTILILTTAYWHQLVSDLTLDALEVIQDIRLIIVGGEALQLSKVKQWHKITANHSPLPQLLNTYGPTEGTIIATQYDFTDPDITNVSIGRPINNIKTYILDPFLNPVPVGVPGELHIGGVGLARGYLNRPELTNEKFVANPFEESGVPHYYHALSHRSQSAGGNKLYKTGDLVRYSPDGNIEYLGRIDNQIKLRGFRIELGEIETVLGHHPNVKTALVNLYEDDRENKSLVAYIIPKNEPQPSPSELRQYLKAKLPEYMIPSFFILLEIFPLTPSGKVDRRALPAPNFDNDNLKEIIAPRNPIEEMLVQSWGQILNRKQIGIKDDFFELGGHSLLATQLVANLRQLFKVELPLKALFSASTIDELGQVIKHLKQEGLTWQEQPILVRNKTTNLPLSFAQTRLWFLDKFEPNSPFYNIPLALKLVGELNKNALEKSLKQIIDRHEILRTNFITIEEVAHQVVKDKMTWEMSVIDLQGQENAQELAQELAQKDAITPFDLEQDPLIRGTLLLLSDREQVLLLCMHHIISDGWSVGILLEELRELYNNYTQDITPQLKPLPIQYGDFTLWQREWLQGERLNHQLQYWQHKLAGSPALLALPTDKPRPAKQSFAGSHYKFELSSEITEKLIELSRKQGVTLFMTLLAAFKTLLYRYSEQEDILVGTPINNRNHSQIEGLIGFFVNTLVLRTDLSGNPSFNDLLSRVRETAIDAYAHQDLPFEMLVEALQPERDLSHAPLFQVDFLLQNEPLSEIALSGLTTSTLSTESTVAKFDLTLGMENTSTGLVGAWEYNTDLFESPTIERMTGHLISLLEAIVANAEQKIGELPLLTTLEQEQILKQWNHTESDYPVEQCVHHLFEDQVKRTPDAVAVCFEGQSLTYQQLNQQANQLAHYLQELGVGSEVFVGLYLERSLSMIVALLAVLKAGGAYVPLDPDYPAKRLAYIAQDSQFNLLITQTSLENTLPIEGLTVICVDQISETLKTQKRDNPVSQVKPENLACLLYTSGSTGKPKGVMLAHEALVSHSWAISEVFGLSSRDRVLQFASFSFDVAAEEIFPTWLTGGTVVLRPVQMFATLTDFADFIESQAITVINITPAYWHEWAVAVSQGMATVPMSLRVAAVGGDAVIPETVTIWKKWVGKRVNCINVYGPTEASVTAIVHDLLDNEAETINSVLIGRPIANTKAYILDTNLQPVPVGVRGELHLCGTRLARGYLHRPQLTAEKFIDNPFDQGGSRLYKTGDVACYLPDGSIECFGRIDNQVKIRGFRIELGEIEAILNQNPEIQTSCVIIREDTPGDKYLVAYVVAHDERVPLISDLRQYLSNQLPLYMVPQAFVFLEALPLTPNRKVDRRALPAPDLYSDRRDNYVPPRNPIEEILTQIWTEILKVEQVGIHDNFFELGGHSLLATQLVSRIRGLFKVEMPLRSVFGAATVAELAAVISQLQQQAITSIIPEILPRTEESELVPSFAQTRLWFLDQLQPNSALYNIPLALRFQGKLDQKALEASLSAICQRHESLRTNFLNINGQPTLVIHPEPTHTVAILDWRNQSADEQQQSIREFVNKESQKPFNLANDSLFRATLLVLSETEEVLWVCMHHIISDGWSMEVFIRELTSLYKTHSQNEASNLAPLPIQYTDFALWQKQWLQGEVLENQLNYWQKQLADAPALLSLPTDRPRPAMQTFVGAYEQFTLSPKVTQGLINLSQQQGVTLFMTLLAAFDVLLSRYTGETDILVGTPIANRNQSELEGLIGFFANTLVLRTNLAGNPSFTALLEQVRTTAMDAYAHQDLPFEMLVEALQPERNLSHNPLFQVAFILHNLSESNIELPDLVISDVSFENTTAKFDLTLALQHSETGLVGVFEYNTDLFDGSTIERMAGHFVTLIEGIVTNPQENVNQLPLLTPVEEKQLLVDWNQTQVEYPDTLCIHQLFEEQVLRSPDAVAVVFEGEQLTYKELNRRGNQLGSYLRSQGVVKGQIVGLCVQRSLEMMIGLLGILKAGGAYLPLDPDYPPERLSYMIEDAQLSILLTQETVREKLPTTQASLICFEEIQEKLGKQPSDNLDERVTSNDLAYLIYTSGSTGKPKGVMVEHGGLYNLSQAQIKTFKLSNTDRILQFASLSFDACIWEIIMTVGVGATLYLDSKENLAPGAPLIERLKEYSITQITLPPSALAVMSEEELPALKTIIVGGEACPPELAKKWSVGRNFFNAYGPTEGSVCATVAPCSENQEKITIGKPINNVQIYILDTYLQPVPIGVTGELHIGGAGLARGYLNRSELTNEKFIFNPFEEGSKLYKTGDLVRYLPDGNIEYIGRIDHQVKVRGFRIELGEIEATLSKLPEVQQAIVDITEYETNDKRLVAYIVPKPEKIQLSKQPANLSTEKIELWPSIAEFYVYDELLYRVMTNDPRRRHSYTVAINRLVKDKIVVEIGTGKDAVLSRFCLEAGAKKVYAIEIDKKTSEQAKDCLEKLGLTEKITVIHGDATSVELPELADVCVSALVGAISGSEGAAVIINNARRFLKPDGLMIPERSITKMAVVTLPDEILHNPKFSEIPAYYTQKIFEEVGYSFDLRVCIKNFPQGNVLSTVGMLEDLQFNEYIEPEFSHEVTLEIEKNGRMDGFLVWLNLHTIVGEEIDILEEACCWLPVYFPIFELGIEVNCGDKIQAVCSRTLCDNNLNPDYAIKGHLLKKSGEMIEFDYVSYHYKQNFRQIPFYQRLFNQSKSENLVQSLRVNLKKRLPDYMIPSNFVVLERFPLTPNGKIDRRALPTPKLQQGKNCIEPRNEIERKLALIWSQVLKLEPIGIDDNFFELGGHSLLATQIISRTQESFNISLPLRYIFDFPTIAQLGEAIAHELETGSRLKLPPIVPANRDAEIPLSWAQERLWFVNQLEGDSGAYTIDLTLRLRGNLDVKALEQAFQALVERHEPLRTQFKLKENKPIQAIASDYRFTLPVVKLQHLNETETTLERMLLEAASEPFDLANGSVLRVKLWQVATDEYVLLLAIHHIAADGWSLGVLIKELSAYYRSFSTETTADLPPVPIQYADFAIWQRQWLTDEILARQLSYWKQQLKDVPLLHQLPSDRPRPPIQSFRGGTEQLQLDPELTEQLKQLSQQTGSTLFMTLLAGFAVLLSRYSGQTDLVIGSPIANRNRTEIEGLIGFFVNSLVLRFDLSQEPTFEEFLAQVREMTQNAYENQDLPFEMLVEELQIERHLDRNPLVQIVFALQNAPDAPWELPGVTVEDMASALDSVRVDLEVYFWDVPQGLTGFCSYNRDLFDAETIARLMSHFQVLLKAIADNPQQSVMTLPLLTPSERQQLLTDWNQTQFAHPDIKCIHQLFEQQVEQTPNGVAIVFEEQQLTYAQLNSRANQLAYYLISLGVSADTLVGICVERSLLMIIGLLAILKAGGAYVPLDPEYPQARLNFMLEDAQVSLLLTQTSLNSKLPQHQAQIIFLEDIPEKVAQNPQDNPQVEVKPTHLANVIYTSGSTGQPKGVMVEHKGLYNLAIAQIETFGLETNSRVLQFASFSFDACLSEILMALGSGASLYLGSKDDLMPGQPLISQLETHRITHITLPPSALAVLPKRELPHLKTIIVAGEACSPELVKQWSVGRNFFNGYGPTEGSVCATIAQCYPDDDKVTIGRPISNVQVYILDSHLQPVPIGVPGELHIGGIGVARGYLNRPQLTAERFISFEESGVRSQESGESKLYKTGDLARYLPDGRIEFLGRIDHQVKVRGFRIETGEIEGVLSQHPLIQDTAVIATEDNLEDKRLVAYLVPGIDSQALPQQVEQWQSDYVSDWQTLYEKAYSQAKNFADDPTFNISGWNSSYTRQAIPAAEMRVWVESTVSRILALSPQNVLEIGCGTGLFVYRVAQSCQEYWATDYSQSAVEYVEQVCQTVAGLDNVHLRQRTADNFEGIPQGKFDTVVLNSVIQYFPSVDYLLQVIEGAIATIKESGSIFLGDVRSLPLLEPYHAAVQFYQADENMTVTQWQQNITDSLASEEELVIDPQFFFTLQQQFPQITWVEIEPKRGYAQNELVQFRYDVTLHLSKSVEVQTVDWLNWQLDDLCLRDLEQQLKQEQPEFLGIRRVPNQRLQQGLQLWKWCEKMPNVETVKQLGQRLAESIPEGINPESLWELGEHLGYNVHLSWWESSQEGCFDVVFCRDGLMPSANSLKVISYGENQTNPPKPWTEYTNNPLQGKLVQKLVPQVRDFLQEKLPNYMIPQGFVLLNTLPLTPNGKIDRRALPTINSTTRHLETGFVSPHSPTEAKLAQIWSEVLGINSIGTKDNFFELGGHSLLATQVISRLRDIFSVEISLQNFLEYPTITGLSQMIEVLTVVENPQTFITENHEDYEEGEL